MSNGSWFDDIPVLAELPAYRAAEALRAVGEADIALSLEQAPAAAVDRPASFGVFDFLGMAPKPWMHAAHTIGFLPRKSTPGNERRIFSAGEVRADTALRNSRIKISLNRLRIASYPGGGTHTILFDFYAENQLAAGTEDVHFNSVFRVEEGSEAGVIGYPIFVGLGVGAEGVVFKCFTVNVKNDQDEKFLAVLDSNIFKKGLQLGVVAQPALGPLSELILGFTRTIAKRHRNVPVQNFQMGLDFGGTRMGARLAQGDYIAVQIPQELRNLWRWSEWEYDAESGQILNVDDGSAIPFNYVVFGITEYEGE